MLFRESPSPAATSSSWSDRGRARLLRPHLRGREFAAHGLETAWTSAARRSTPGAARCAGLHYQAAPHGEAKLVRCTRGAIYDVAVDLRPASPSYLRWVAAELTAENGRALYVPEGCAHGFQTLEDASEVLYQISSAFVPEAARGVRWDDPAFSIEWPPAPPGGRTMAGRDARYPDFAP